MSLKRVATDKWLAILPREILAMIASYVQNVAVFALDGCRPHARVDVFRLLLLNNELVLKSPQYRMVSTWRRSAFGKEFPRRRYSCSFTLDVVRGIDMQVMRVRIRGDQYEWSACKVEYEDLTAMPQYKCMDHVLTAFPFGVQNVNFPCSQIHAVVKHRSDL